MGDKAVHLEIKALSCGYSVSAPPVIRDFSLSIRPGDVLCVLGRNGIGKTTLFRTLLGTLAPLSGSVHIGGRDLAALTRRERAALIAYVPQTHHPPFAYTAFDIVLMGRAGLMSAFSLPSARDKQMAAAAMEALGVEALADRAYTRISGGERQMVLIARALAQGADFLFLDEPAANLDVSNQMRVLAVLRGLAESGKGVVFTSHDPGHALLLGAQTAVVRGASQISVGAAADLITKDMAESLYGVRAEIVEIFDETRGRHVKVFAPFLD
jgi:iron complex transport system ATP-binding protein